ncbi:Capsule polysaccharide biosynthesis protein [compost metagenome]
MKYLTVVYYDTFARFFSAMEDEVRLRDSEAEFLHLALFPSAYLYLALERKSVRLLPWEATKASSACASVEDVELDRIGAYHSYILSGGGRQADARVRQRAAKYVNAVSEILRQFRPDRVIMSGDTRIACEALSICLARDWPDVPKFHFEQGPGGTTIFDTAGVNANCSFRYEAASLTGEGYSADIPPRRGRFKRNPLFRGCDYLLSGGLKVVSRLPVEWKTLPMPRCSEKRYAACLEDTSAGGAVVGPNALVALQVPDDANNIHHNPLGLSDAQFVQMAVIAVRQLGGRVVVREHPLYRRKYSPELYELISTTPDVVLSSAELKDDLSAATVVVTVNSTTGFDAYMAGVPSILLGRAFYDHLPGIVRVESGSGLEQAISSIQEMSVADLFSGFEPGKIVAEMRDRFLIDGHLLDAQLVAPSTIADIVHKGGQTLGSARRDTAVIE